MPFKTPDGKEFATRVEWRDYMMATFYSYKNKVNETLIKLPGDVDGQGFDIADCEGSTLVVMDNCEQVQIDEVKNSRIFIGACASSIFIRNCTNCVFYTSCRQLRLRDVKDSNFYIYSMSEVHIEFSSNVRFAPFNGGYPDQLKHLQNANLDPKKNLWYDVFDHNDPMKSRVNWSLIPTNEYEDPWYPAGVCEPAVPVTVAGSISNPNIESNSGMQAFGFDQLMADAKPVPVVPSTSAPEILAPSLPAPDTPESRITHVLTSFCAFRPGNNPTIFAEGFELVKPNGDVVGLEGAGGGSLSGVSRIAVTSDSSAWASFLMEANGIVVCTAILTASEGGWKLALVQLSTPRRKD